MAKLFRTNGLIAGVCGGLGQRFNINAWIFRILWILFGLTGVGILVYLICWVVMPKA